MLRSNDSWSDSGECLSDGGQSRSVSEESLARIVRVIVNEVDPETVILFGSQARGDATPNSDVDLIVIESEPFDASCSRLREAARLYRALAHFPVTKDILLYSQGEVEYWKDSLNYVIARALREGRVLYERP